MAFQVFFDCLLNGFPVQVFFDCLWNDPHEVNMLKNDDSLMFCV